MRVFLQLNEFRTVPRAMLPCIANIVFPRNLTIKGMSPSETAAITFQ